MKTADLKKRCSMQIKDFENETKVLQPTEHVNGFLGYIDRGADILAVAHLDYVVWQDPIITKSRIKCGQLDDRLGAWMILDVLPELGINADILLTDQEEIGQSTAKYFTPEKDYRYCFSFDRPEVMQPALYDQLENIKLCDSVQSVGLNPVYGLFSDVCELRLPKVNFGAGYQLQHTTSCFAKFASIQKAIRLFQKWYETTADISFEYLDEYDSLGKQWTSEDTLLEAGVYDFLEGYIDYMDFRNQYQMCPIDAMQKLGYAI